MVRYAGREFYPLEDLVVVPVRPELHGRRWAFPGEIRARIGGRTCTRVREERDAGDDDNPARLSHPSGPILPPPVLHAPTPPCPALLSLPTIAASPLASIGPCTPPDWKTSFIVQPFQRLPGSPLRLHNSLVMMSRRPR